MAFNINEFKATLDRGTVALSSHYEVQITRPQGLFPDPQGVERDLMFRVDQVDVPGRSIRTAEVKYYNSPVRLMGYDSNYAPCTMSVLLSEDLREKIYLELWQDAIIGHHRLGVINQGMYDLGFYSDYVGTVLIKTFDVTGKQRAETKLIEAYPMQIGVLSASWAGADQPLKLLTTFAYRYYLDTIIS